MSRTMVGTPVNLVAFSFSMIFRASPASHLRIMRIALPRGSDHRQVLPRAVMWNMGTAMSAFEFSSGIRALINSPSFMQAPTLRCVWTTPFGNPVLPDVYMIIASSSCWIPLYEGGFAKLPLLITESQRASAPRSCADASSPRQRIVFTPRPLRKGAHSLSRSASAMSNFIAESFTAYSNSSVFHNAFKGTATPPM